MSSTAPSHRVVKPKAIRCHPLPMQGELPPFSSRTPFDSFSRLVDLTKCDYATLLRVAKVSNPPSAEKKRTRILFTSWQVAELERLFAEQKYVSAQERLAISIRIGLSPTQIKIWFQNRRYKSKKTTILLRTTSEFPLSI